MNVQQCANCATYGWKQVEDKTKLKKCSKCNLIYYCDKECQTEHWKKVHGSHCKYFKDPSKAQSSFHRVENCAICLLEHPWSKLKQQNNPNYKCSVYSFMTMEHFHPHHFPAVGKPGDTLEKAAIVLEHLVLKKMMIQPGFSEQIELGPLQAKLLFIRCLLWANRKILPEDKDHKDQPLLELHELYEIEESYLRNKLNTMPDPFKMWKSIFLVHSIFLEARFTRDLKALKDPLASLHVKFRSIVAKALENSAEYLSVADKVLEALASEVIPYEEVLKILCGGSLKQWCSFCLDEVIISGLVRENVAEDKDVHRLPQVFLNPLFGRIFGCGRKNCRDEVESMKEEKVCFMMAITTTVKEREGNQCDYCFQLPPTKAVHRCSRCRTKMYCSVACEDKDWDIHKLGCKEKDVDERKIKAGSSGRREVAAEAKKDLIEKIEKFDIPFDFVDENDIGEVFENLKYKRGQKKTQEVERKKKVDDTLPEEEERLARLGPGGLDPAEVLESLPREMQDNPMLEEFPNMLPEEEARLHMKRCDDRGLWCPAQDDPSTNAEDSDKLMFKHGKEKIQKEATEKVADAMDEKEEERLARLGQGGLNPDQVLESFPKEMQDMMDIPMLKFIKTLPGEDDPNTKA